MFGPPKGYDDLLGDAETAPPLPEPAELLVPGIGVLQARRPAPRSAGVLAAITRPGISKPARLGLMTRFVTDHIGEQQTETLLDAMMRGELPEDTLGRVSRALCRWGTSRPYAAVCNLAAITGQHWRTIRQTLLEHGVTDPMRLPSLHVLLDETEKIVIESMHGRTAAQTQTKREHFYNQLYRPDPDPADEVNGGDYQPVPDGFEEGEDDDAFDAFARAMQ